MLQNVSFLKDNVILSFLIIKNIYSTL